MDPEIETRRSWRRGFFVSNKSDWSHVSGSAHEGDYSAQKHDHRWHVSHLLDPNRYWEGTQWKPFVRFSHEFSDCSVAWTTQHSPDNNNKTKSLATKNQAQRSQPQSEKKNILLATDRHGSNLRRHSSVTKNRKYTQRILPTHSLISFQLTTLVVQPTQYRP